MWAAFFGLMVINRFPRLKPEAYDPRITEGKIGLLAQMDEGLVEVSRRLMREQGAFDVIHIPTPPVRGHRAWNRFALGFAILVVLAGVVTMVFTYDLVRIPFPTNMSDQDSIGYEQGPRLAAPVEAVPVQGPALIAGQPASEPLPSDAASLQRGGVLFGLNCVVCHGQAGDGKGNLSGFFTPRPADLTSQAVQSLSDDDIFLVISNGFGLMPSLADNLSASDRWAVINHVRTLGR
jgi:mono/diheme cytochrome c family protein